jgi:hypothetical protein
MINRPDFIMSGDEARLFPILAETSREKRVASIFLAVMTQIPALAEEVLATVGIRVGKYTKIRAFTEVVVKIKSDGGCRPDGLIVVNTGRSEWTALVEAKIGKRPLTEDQVQKYIELAKVNGIDAVITISNQFTAKPEHSPVSIQKTQLRKVSLYHWSWPWLVTVCKILTYQETVEDAEQTYLLSQLNHFLAHPATGIEHFTQMAPSWKDITQSVANHEALRKTSPDVEGWRRNAISACISRATSEPRSGRGSRANSRMTPSDSERSRSPRSLTHTSYRRRFACPIAPRTLRSALTSPGARFQPQWL